MKRPLTRKLLYDKFLVFIRKLNLVANKKSTSPIPDFEGTLNKLETIVSTMEEGDLSLEQALKQFELGVALARECQQALNHAEQRVQELMAESNGLPKRNDENPKN